MSVRRLSIWRGWFETLQTETFHSPFYAATPESSFLINWTIISVWEKYHWPPSMSSYELAAKEIDKQQEKFIARLAEAVAIPSVSADAVHREDVFRMVKWTQNQMQALHINVGARQDQKTLLVYGHLDVQPAHIDDGWNSEPFKLTIKDGKMYGRGSTDDKGPVIGWLNAIEVMQSLNVEIPVNIKFVFEGMEESLDDVLEQHKDTFLADVNFTCISDNYWLGKKKPCITYGLRGICYYTVEISSPKQDLHSGCFGGTIHEPMNDLCWVLSQLTDVDGKIMVDGIDALVAPLTDAEKELYKTIDFDATDYAADLGVKQLTSENPQQILMNRWRFPALSIHGVEGAFSGAGAKTVIPCKVVGKFSIRLVPDMVPSAVDECVHNYLNKVWSKRGSPCNFKVTALQGGHPWVANFKHPHYQAGARALKRVFGVDPDFTR
uniref:Peptidase M20 dimerisation domain-containing protein n=1 Tax=Ditylenchus dipsaci TaxID=166011 RepID=A0A915D4H9_9BILA